MKKGFTVVELIITFSLTVVIATFLLQLILSLNNLYKNSGIKTELLNRQFIISNKINKTLNEKELISLTSCGNNCLNFNYSDNTKDVFKIDYSNNILQFGNFSTTLPNDTYFKNVNIDIVYSTTIDYNSNNAILNINIPIHNDKLSNEDFNVNIAYQYNSNKANISYVNFSGSDNYIVLKGDTEQTINSKTSYIEQGYTVYDKNGNTISGNVEIDNPLTTLPYKSGRYIIKYNLKDNNGNIISQATRSVEVEPSVYEITNLVTNGSFENDNNIFTNGAVSTNYEIVSTYSKSGSRSIAVKTINSTVGSDYIQTANNNIINLNHQYYYSTYYISEFVPVRIQMWSGAWKTNSFHPYSVYYPISYIWNKSSMIISDTKTAVYSDVSLRLINSVNDNVVESIVYYDDIILIDLTETFGAGNEPSQEWCDENINWFEGTTTINY